VIFQDLTPSASQDLTPSASKKKSPRLMKRSWSNGATSILTQGDNTCVYEKDDLVCIIRKKTNGKKRQNISTMITEGYGPDPVILSPFPSKEKCNGKY